MRKTKTITAILCSLALLAGCGNAKGAANTETTSVVTNPATEVETTSSVNQTWDRIPSVMIDGVMYQDTGYVSSAIGCGTMDGEITSEVDGSELPAKDNQSNFGTGYAWQRGSEGQIIVVIDGRKEIFRDPEHPFDSDIPAEVLNFRAKVLENRGGSLLVSVMDAPDMFMLPVTGECVIPTDNMESEDIIADGDILRVWSDGLVQEIYPPILPNVYRIVKEEAGPGETSLSLGEYHQNTDGTWSYKEKSYQYRLMLTGKLPNAVGESFYIVLSNNKDVSFEEISHRLLSSTFIPETDNSPAVVNMGVYDDLCNVESAGVLVSASYITPYGLTVLFDQYDHQISEELLTGEHFALDRWTGEGWDPLDTVISDYGFTDIGYPLKKGGMTRKVFNWDWLYGKLEPGRYRIRVQVIGSEVYEAAAVFTISSGDTGAAIDVGDSGLYSEQDRLDAAAVILEEISSWEGCELHQLWYTSDEQNTADNISWMNELAEGQGLKEQFTECMQFKSNYHSPVDPDKAGGWEPDEEYTNWEWWLARADGGEWHLMTWGY